MENLKEILLGSALVVLVGGCERGYRHIVREGTYDTYYNPAPRVYVHRREYRQFRSIKPYNRMIVPRHQQDLRHYDMGRNMPYFRPQHNFRHQPRFMPRHNFNCAPLRQFQRHRRR